MAGIIADLLWLKSAVEADGGGPDSGGPFLESVVVQSAIAEIERLRRLLRGCQRGTYVIDIGDGEIIGLYQRESDMTDTSNMPAYECHKTVWALQIASVGNYRPAGDGRTVRAITFDDASEREIGEAVFRRYIPVPGDFYVVYEDGYESFSPKDVFLAGYRPVDKRSFADIKAETKR